MRTIQVTADLLLEGWPGSDVDRPLLKLRSRGQEHDGETPPGVLIVYLDEVRPLVAALTDAAVGLVEEAIASATQLPADPSLTVERSK